MKGAFCFCFFLVSLLGVGCVPSRKRSNNWAVLLCTSKYWFNYRHLSNTLAVYQTIKQSGIPDSQIILMNALDIQCDSRNRFPGHVYDTDQSIPYLTGDKYMHTLDSNFGDASKKHVPLSLCDESLEMDYTGEDVNMRSLMELLTGRHEKRVPASKRLATNENSNVLLFISGHGGDEFMKFQDYEEITAQDIAHGIHEMYLKKRFKNLLLVVDTCQASTLGQLITTPNVISLSSSKRDENSYAYRSNSDIGVSVIDRFSYKLVEYLKSNGPQIKSGVSTIGNFFRSLSPRFLQSTPMIETTFETVSAVDDIPLKWFFDQDKLFIRYKNMTTSDIAITEGST